MLTLPIHYSDNELLDIDEFNEDLDNNPYYMIGKTMLHLISH